MKRPSNLIIAFILAIAGIFFIYGFGRVLFQLIKAPEIEVEEDYQSYLGFAEKVFFVGRE